MQRTSLGPPGPLFVPPPLNPALLSRPRKAPIPDPHDEQGKKGADFSDDEDFIDPIKAAQLKGKAADSDDEPVAAPKPKKAAAAKPKGAAAAFALLAGDDVSPHFITTIRIRPSIYRLKSLT